MRQGTGDGWEVHSERSISLLFMVFGGGVKDLQVICNNIPGSIFKILLLD
jgi:hypothetical protein